jgi:hypothetical protein
MYARYWLTHSAVLDEPGGHSTIEIDAPRLVELLPGGRVRSSDGATPTFQGFLPADVLEEPRGNGGLMLYAHAVGELRAYDPAGPVLGRIHPGAFVSVVPSEGKSIRVGNLPFQLAMNDKAVYVDRAVLDSEPREPAAFRPAGRSRSIHLPFVTGWVPNDVRGGSWTSTACEGASWVVDEGIVVHHARGLEFVGTSDHFGPATTAWAMSSQEGLRCPAHTVASDDGIPAGYEKLAPINPDPLPSLIARGQTIHWLVATEKGPVCDAWRFATDKRSPAPSPSRINGRLVRLKMFEYGGTKHNASHPMRYAPASGATRATLHLDSIQLDARNVMKCDCDYDYTVLRSAGDELEVMGRPLPENARAYDPRDAERWFLSSKSCENARGEAARVLEQDGTTAAGLGFHAVVSSLGL